MKTRENLAGMFRFGTRMMERALAGLDRKQSLTRIATGANPILWIAGHATATRFRIAAMVGTPLPLPWADVFGQSSALVEDSAYPEAADVLEHWNRVSDPLVKRLETMSEEELCASAPPGFPPIDEAGSIAGFLTLSVFHEGYHMGQISLIRRSLGFSSLVG